MAISYCKTLNASPWVESKVLVEFSRIVVTGAELLEVVVADFLVKTVVVVEGSTFDWSSLRMSTWGFYWALRRVMSIPYNFSLFVSRTSKNYVKLFKSKFRLSKLMLSRFY